MTQPLRLEVDAGRVRSAFASLRHKLASGLRGAWERVGAEMDEAATPYVPVKSGALVDNVRAQAGLDSVELTADLIYAGVQDRGWPAHNIAGHHFMDKAADVAPDVADRELSQGIQALIDSVGLR